VETGKDLERFQGKLIADGNRPLAFSPDGGTLAATTDRGTVHLLDVKKGEEIDKLPPPEPGVNNPVAVAFSPDGRFLAVGTFYANCVMVCDLRKGKPAWEFEWPEPRDPKQLARGRTPDQADADPKQKAGILAVAFTPDGRSLLAICNDSRTRLWEMATGGLRYRANEPADFLAVASAGRLFATATNTAESREIAIRDFRTCVAPCRPAPRPVEPDKAWADLGSSDAALAYERMRALICTPKDSLTILDNGMPTVDPVKAVVIEGLIRDLDDDRFEVRDRAKRRLADLGQLAKTALTEALAKGPSVDAGKRMKELLETLEGPLSGDRLRLVRAVEVLESIASPDARRVLKRLAAGDPSALLTGEAKAALNRLDAE
jgi:hypothetical protein